MIQRTRIILIVSVVLLLSVAFVRSRAKAAQTGTSRGVTLLVLACGNDPGNPQVFGPNSGLFINGGWCDGYGQLNSPRLPAGMLYNLRAIVGSGTSDAQPATLKVMIHTSASKIPILVCEANTISAVCQDLTHSVTVNAGDTVSASVSIPDSNTWVGAVTITLEENIIE